MPRIQRMKIDDQSTVYHVMSRTALDGFPLGDIEKDYMLDLIQWPAPDEYLSLRKQPCYNAASVIWPGIR